jgi:hypothetical protein
MNAGLYGGRLSSALIHSELQFADVAVKAVPISDTCSSRLRKTSQNAEELAKADREAVLAVSV